MTDPSLSWRSERVDIKRKARGIKARVFVILPHKVFNFTLRADSAGRTLPQDRIPMKIRKLSAGDIIDARCTRCREILNHRIVAMVQEKVVRVECNTCKGVHNYYPPPTAKTPRTSGTGPASKTAAAPRQAKKDPGQTERDEWTALRPGMDFDRALKYDMNAKYKANDLLDHPTFGFGVIKVVIVPNKMQVLFEDGIKLLRCK